MLQPKDLVCLRCCGCCGESIFSIFLSSRSAMRGVTFSSNCSRPSACCGKRNMQQSTPMTSYRRILSVTTCGVPTRPAPSAEIALRPSRIWRRASSVASACDSAICWYGERIKVVLIPYNRLRPWREARAFMSITSRTMQAKFGSKSRKPAA